MGLALDFLLDTRDSGTFIIDPLGRFSSEESIHEKMNIDTDFIPETSTTSTTSTTTTSTTATTITIPTKIIPTTICDSTTAQQDLSYPPGVKREYLIDGLSELEKDILILSLSGLVLVLFVGLVVLCIKWKRSRPQTGCDFHNLSAGTSLTIFDSSKVD